MRKVGKTLIFFLALCVGAVSLGAAGKGFFNEVNAAEQEVVSLTFPDDNKDNNGTSSYNSVWEASANGYLFAIENFSNNSWKNDWEYIKCGNKDSDSICTITSPVFEVPITKVELDIDGASPTYVSSINLKMGESASSLITLPDSFKNAKGQQCVTIGSPLENQLYQIEFSCLKTKTNGAFTLKSVTFYMDRRVETIDNVTAPASVEQYSKIPLDEVELDVTYNDKTTDTINPDSIECDTSKPGDDITATAKVEDVSQDFYIDVTPFTGFFYDFTDPNVLNDWSTSYQKRVVDYEDATITFASAAKPSSSSAITDRPVTKGSEITLVAKKDRTIAFVNWAFSQWAEKKQTITLEYSVNHGISYNDTDPATVSDNFKIFCGDLPEGTNAVKILFSSNENQIGVTSCAVKFNKYLESINLDTTYVKKEFVVGEEFTYENLVVTAFYSDDTWLDVDPTEVIEPDLSTKGEKTVTVIYEDEYGTDSKEYNIIVYEQGVTKHTISFYSNSEIIHQEDVAEGYKVPKPTDPIYEGHIFGGWYKDNETFEDQWDFENDKMGTSDIDLFAKWTIVSYSLTYNKNGGTGDVPSGGTFTYPNLTAMVSEAPNTLKKNQHKFVSWNTKSDATGTSYTPGSQIILDSDITLYATWAKADVVGVSFELKDNSKVFSEGDSLTAKDFKFTVTFETGEINTGLSSGFTFTVNDIENGKLVTGANEVYVTYSGVSSNPINITAIKAIESSFKLVTNTSELASGQNILIVGEESGEYFALAPYVDGNNCDRNEIPEPENDIVTTKVKALTLSTKNSNWTLFDGSHYLYAAGGKTNNYLKGTSNADNLNAQWNITFSNEGIPTIKTVDETVGSRTILHNTLNDLFSCYKEEGGNFKHISIYAEILTHNNSLGGWTMDDGEKKQIVAFGFTCYFADQVEKDIDFGIVAYQHIDEEVTYSNGTVQALIENEGRFYLYIIIDSDTPVTYYAQAYVLINGVRINSPVVSVSGDLNGTEYIL